MDDILAKLRAVCADLNQGLFLQWRYPPRPPADPVDAAIDPAWPIWTNDPPFPLTPGQKCWFYCEVETLTEYCGLHLGDGDLLLGIWGWFPFTLWIDGQEAFREEHLWKATGPISEPLLLQSGRKHRLVLCLEPGALPSIWPSQSIGSGPFEMGIDAKPAARMAIILEAAGQELEFASRLAQTDGERDVVSQAAKRLDLAALDARNWQTVTASIAAMEASLAPVFGDRAKSHVVHLVGHTHLDMDWMWTWPETVRCIRRDFKAVTQLMEDYPELCFTHSQVPTYQVVQEMDPDVFAKVKLFIAQGRWECAAGTWVEGDLNMADGESIARHILYGKQWTKANLGVEAEILWEPDTFGHPGSMPQIASLGEMPSYFHWRCGPEEREFVPVREWEAFDGSTVLAVNRNYAGNPSPANLFGAAMGAMKYGRQNSCAITGWGDHGGGYGRLSLEYLEEFRHRPITPTIRFNTMGRYLEAVRAEDKPLPRQKGETFFMFPGCFTSAAQMKRDNRLAENVLLNAEAMCAMAGIDRNDQLANAWKPVLFSQFHDLLDGSSIKDAYADAHSRAETSMATAAAVSREALCAMVTAQADGGTLTLINASSLHRTEPVRCKLPKGTAALADETGALIPMQRCGDEYVFIARGIAPFSRRSYRILGELPGNAAFPAVRVGPWGAPEENGTQRFLEVETDFASIVLDTLSGAIGSFVDKRTGRDLVRACASTALTFGRWSHQLHNGLNVFELIDEQYTLMSSWDIDELKRVEYLLHAQRVELLEAGPVFARFRVSHAFRNSRIDEDILFYREHPRVDFRATVDWREKASKAGGIPMLKVAFNVSLTAPQARFEGPFTIVNRPVDGRELPTQRFLHVSGQEFACTLLNDSKYGCDVLGGRARITLLRNPECPDPDPDTGVHTIGFVFHPHPEPEVSNGEVFALGVAYNRPLLHTTTAEKPGSGASFVTSSNPSVVITALRKAEYSDRLLVRLFETSGSPSQTVLTFERPVQSAQVVNFLENITGEAIAAAGRTVTVLLHGFEIKTLLVELAK